MSRNESGASGDLARTVRKDGRVIELPLGRLGEKDAFDRDFWRRARHEANFAAAWEMVKEAALIRGQDASESRLQRHILRIERGRG